MLLILLNDKPHGSLLEVVPLEGHAPPPVSSFWGSYTGTNEVTMDTMNIMACYI